MLAGVLVLAVLVHVLVVERRVRRFRSNTVASRHLVTVELERRYVQLDPFIAAAEASGIDQNSVRQLVGARSWSKAVRDRGLDLSAQAAAENALSAAVHAVRSEADAHPTLRSNWAFQGPAGDLNITDKRIAGAVRVYNDNAYRLASLRTSLSTKMVAKAMKVSAPEPFVEHIPLYADEQPQDVPA